MTRLFTIPLPRDNDGTFILGKQTAEWSGYKVSIKKRPIKQLGNTHFIYHNVSVPVGLRGLSIVAVEVFEDRIIIEFP